LLFALLGLAACVSPADPLGTAFTYQGMLSDGGTPAEGLFDLCFTIYDAADGGAAVAGSITNSAVFITNGLFTVALDFGPGVFTGSARWLEIGVRTNGALSDFTLLSPRQPLTAAPYAHYTPNAGAAAIAAAAATAGSVAAANVTGTLALNQLPGAVVTNNAAGITLAGTFTGNGAALANVNADLLDGQHGAYYQNAANLTSGTLADARLPGSVALRTSTNTFTATNVFTKAVGIDCFNPGQPLQVGNPNTFGSKGMIRLASRSSNSGEQRVWDIGVPETSNNVSGAGYCFVVDDTQFGTDPEFLVHWGNGYVGIGRTNPVSALDVNGTVTATGFAGNGSGLTNLNASQLTSGTVPMVRLPGGLVTNNATGLTLTGAFTGNASGLTNLNASQLATGIVPLAHLPPGIVTNNATGINLAGSFSGNGAGLTNLNAGALASGTVSLARLPAALVTNNASGVTLAGSFSGNGAGVTNVSLVTVNTHGAIDWTTTWGNFALASSPGANNNPQSLKAADLNGDGRLDLVCVNPYTYGLSLLFNNGGGSFGTPAWIALGGGGQPYDVAAADVNGDSHVDLVAAVYNINTLLVYTNNGTGVFQYYSTATLGTGPFRVTAADVNGDSRVDLITANYGGGSGNTLTVLTNNGTGRFTATATLTVGLAPLFVTAADVNGDGSADLISANYGSNTLSVLTNNGSGGFTTTATLTVGQQPRCVVAADVNGDGATDLISANSGSATFSVLTNSGSGGFTLASSPGAGGIPNSVAAADVNADGWPDLISANWSANTLTVLTNNGSGAFGWSATLSVGSNPNAVIAADLSGDGQPDLASANEFGNNLSVLFNTPSYRAGFEGSYAGNGAGLTNLNAATLTGTAGSLSASNINVLGAIVGNGAGLTNLGAAALTGTLADARLSPNVALLNAHQVFTGSNRFAGATALTNAANTLAGAFTGNGAGLTNLGAAALTGTLADARLSPNVALLNAHQVFTGSNRFAGVTALTNAANTLAGAFTGNGSGLTNLNASQLAAGTVPWAQLPDGLITNNAANVSLAGAFSGNGGGLTNVPGAVPWQTVAGTNQVAQPNQAYLLTNSALVTLTLPSSPNLGDVVRVSGAGAGGWKIAQNSGQIIMAGSIPGNIGASWTARATTRNWTGIASSADGSKLVAVVSGGQIHTSTDSGVTWTARDSNRSWSAVASSADGAKLVAVTYGGQIYTSTNSGITWTARDSNRDWFVVASSADGTKLVAAVQNGQIYTSSNSGVNWTARDSTRWWTGVASSADGTRLVACVGTAAPGQIYTSGDSGVTWTNRGSSEYWHGVASSADGSKLVAVVYGGQIHTSTDFGLSWVGHASSRIWQSVASSADGSKLVAVVYGGQIYTSTDSGVTWTARTSNRNWYSVACSDDGSKLVAVVAGGQIFTSIPATTLGASGYLNGSQYSAVELQYVGNGVFMPLSNAGTILAY